MNVPPLRSGDPALRVISEVARLLAGGLGSPTALSGVSGALRRGLNLARCRLWCRAPDGVGYVAIATPGEGQELAEPPPVASWIAQGVTSDPTAHGLRLRVPLVHDESPLGAMEVILPVGPDEALAHDVVLTVADLLSPVLAAAELSSD